MSTPSAAASFFVDRTIMHDRVSTTVLRYPTAALEPRLIDEGKSYYNVYKKYAKHPITLNNFADLMRNHKGHTGPCGGGCGCKSDGNFCLKRVSFKSSSASPLAM